MCCCPSLYCLGVAAAAAGGRIGIIISNIIVIAVVDSFNFVL